MVKNEKLNVKQKHGKGSYGKLYVNEATRKSEILNSLPSGANNVRVLTSGNKETVFFGSTKIVELEKGFTFKNSYIFKDVYSEIYKTYKKHYDGTILVVNDKKQKSIPYFGERVDKVDIESCYLRTAVMLGYISKKKYRWLLTKYDDIKIEFCAAITSLGSDSKMVYKDRGTTIKCDNGYLKNISDNIINHSVNIMTNYQGKYFDKNVDGILIPHRNLGKLLTYLLRNGYHYTVSSGTFWGENTYLKENGDLLD